MMDEQEALDLADELERFRQLAAALEAEETAEANLRAAEDQLARCKDQLKAAKTRTRDAAFRATHPPGKQRVGWRKEA